ncbi:hypothetical protein ACH5RR_022509 [Cinchona calisaya]|uniref:Patatin n=1 Tax=Cinchona calisaya TaxID=153742 RepID=A0ABD2Z808_9GENT
MTCRLICSDKFSMLKSQITTFNKPQSQPPPEKSFLRWLQGGSALASLIDLSQDAPDGVVWEQREEDVAAELRWKKERAVTSLGFSFSPAGLLFPYHLGVAQFLIEMGCIKEMTPLAGSSAGAIVCAVIASGVSMQDALRATKIFSEACRRKGTAFRFWAVLRDVLQNFLPVDAHIRSSGRVRASSDPFLLLPLNLFNCCMPLMLDLQEEGVDSLLQQSKEMAAAVDI